MDVRPFLDPTCRLFIKSLPSQFSTEDTVSFLQAFGAIHVDVMSRFGKMKRSAFANFINQFEAKLAMSRLHQLKVLGARLIVLWATPKQEEHAYDSINSTTPQDTAASSSYQFPKITDGTLANISTLISTNEQFYTQVLHVMNRMELPPPFVPEGMQPFVAMVTHKNVSPNGSDTELELEPLKPVYDPIPHGPVSLAGLLAKRAEAPIEHTGGKKQKLEIKLSTGVDSSSPAMYSTFDTPLPFGILQKQDTPPDTSQEHSRMSPIQLESYISDRELYKDRLTPHELRTHSLFREYSIGNPSSRLYVKNLARKTTKRDLRYLYGRYVDFENEQDSANYVITLLVSGRMRGQAFVGLSSPEVARRAMEDTNGYLLYGRPMVVSFARSAL